MDLQTDCMRLVIDHEKGTVRAVTLDGRAEFLTEIRYGHQLSEHDIRYIAGILLTGKQIGDQLPLFDRPQLTYALDFRIDKIPRQPVIKMMKAEHAEMFLSEGRLRLGSINHYRSYEHTEIGDPTEGECILVGMNRASTIVRHVVGGLHEWLFCCYAGEPDPNVVQQFGYDAAIQIKNVAGFSEAINAALGAEASHFSRCKYSKDRVVVGPSDEDIHDAHQHPDFYEILGYSRAFIKHNRFQHQREFRFLWSMPTGVEGFLDIVAPEAARYCEIVAVKAI